MSFVFKCSHCGADLKGEEEWRGMRSECPICGHDTEFSSRLRFFGGRRDFFACTEDGAQKNGKFLSMEQDFPVSRSRYSMKANETLYFYEVK